MQISKDHYLAEGRQKVVYHHPENSELCIKIPKFKKGRGYAPFFREVRYIQKFQEKLSYITSYEGKVETNLGVGYLFSMVRDFDGAVSISLEGYPHKLKGLQSKVELLFEDLLKHKAPVSEMRARNLLVKRISNEEYELHLVDGFGNSDIIKHCDYLRVFLRQKLVRKFRILCKDLNLNPDFLLK